MAVVVLRGISKLFPGGVTAVDGVDLTVSDSEMFALVGPSGSGKSTLLRLIAGLEPPTCGSVEIGGRDVTRSSPRARDVAMVFQNPALYPHLSVFENLAFGLRARGVRRKVLASRVEAVAQPLGLGDVLKRRPQTLSGGQRQRVALGRAIARRPAVFLFDEPMSSLDLPLRAALRAELIDLHRSLGATMIYVTHEQSEALALGDRVGVMDQGRLVQVGRPSEVYEWPTTRFVAEFVGDPPMNIVRVEVEVRDDGRTRVHLADTTFVVDSLTLGCQRTSVDLGLRPEHIAIVRENEELSSRYAWRSTLAEVARVEFLGSESVVTIRFGPESLRVRTPAGNRYQVGDRVRVGLDFRRASWFDPETGAAIAREVVHVV